MNPLEYGAKTAADLGEWRQQFEPQKNPDSPLYRKVTRLIARCEKDGYKFNSIELGMFDALGRVNWVEEKANWLAVEVFYRLYDKIYGK